VFKWLTAAAALAIALPLALVLLAVTISPASQASATLAGGPSVQALDTIPPAYLALYLAAAQTCPGLPWAVLAGIGKVESDHGQSDAPGVHSGANYAGAEVPPCSSRPPPSPSTPSTPASPSRSARTTRRMRYTPPPRCSAPPAPPPAPQTGIRQAIYGYNHSQAYVTAVLAWTARYTTPAPTSAAAAAIAVRKVGKPYCFSWGPGGEITLNPRVCPAQRD